MTRARREEPEDDDDDDVTGGVRCGAPVRDGRPANRKSGGAFSLNLFLDQTEGTKRNKKGTQGTKGNKTETKGC